jgi:cytochrome c oxidase subunit 3
MDTVHSSGPTAARTGVWVGIAAISMSFAAYTSALLVRGGAGGSIHVDLPPILFLNTAILLASSATLTVAQRRFRAAPADGFAALGGSWLAATLALGLLFLAGQFLAWQDLRAQGLYLASTPGSSFFYVFTALHALHLLGGILALAWVVWRLGSAPASPPRNALGATALYWHFMDVLWLYLLVVLMVRL